jgi:hypothetical protein
MKLIFILGLLSLSGFTYGQQATGINELIAGDCVDLVEWLNKKTDTLNIPARYCGNVATAEHILNNQKYMQKCLQKTAKVAGINKDLLIYCQDLNLLSDIERPEFSECLIETNEMGFGITDHKRIDICRNKASLSLLKDESFGICMSSIELQHPKSKINDRFIQCQRPESRKFVSDPGYLKCRTRFQDSKLPKRMVSGFCSIKENQNSQKYDQLNTCVATVDNIFGKKSGEMYCFGQNVFAKLADPENFACLMTTHHSVSPTFFEEQAYKESENKLQSIIEDCEANKNRKPLEGEINYLGAYYFSADEKFDNAIIGGLSGITYDPAKDIFHVVSDDPGRLAPSRFYSFKANFEKQFRFTPVSKTQIGTGQDSESIQMAGNGIVAISSESLSYNSINLIRAFTLKGKQVGNISIPNKFLKSSEPIEGEEPEQKPRGFFRRIWDDPLTKGMQDNKGLESLAIPEDDKNIMFTVTEAPLLQDDMPERKIVRIVKLTKDNKGLFNQTQEYAYEMENSIDNGISDVLALNDHELLILERRYDRATNVVEAAIFKVDLSQAQDVSSIESFRVELKEERALSIVPKRVVIDLSDLLPYLPAGLRKIDNVEGMALGPELDSGHRALIIVADNNFSKYQYNQVLVLKLPVNLK